MPRNRELMRVFRDLELVEQLGSGVHRILSVYDSSIFYISEHFFEIRFPINKEAMGEAGEGEPGVREQVGAESGDQARDQVRDQVKRLLAVMEGEQGVVEIMNLLALKGRRSFRESYLKPALSTGLIEMTQPEAPNSPTQKYRLTAAGRKLLSTATGNTHD